ncbi:MAG: hypothetical protein ACM34L_12985 [Gemmatimonas sp.]
MRSIGLPLVLAPLIVAIACTSDRAVAPESGHTGQLSGIPPELFAAYTRVSLPGTETVVALNDSGDVVGATNTGGVLWHGANHERTILPIIPTAIANDGTVAGSIDGHAATWKNGRVTVLDTAASMARAICRCESATVVGSVQVNGDSHAAIWVDGIRIDAGVPPNAKHAEFSSIATGFVVGNAIVRGPDPHSQDSADFVEPFSWSPAGGWVPFRLDHVTVAVIVSLNSHGIAVGAGSGPNFSNTLGVLFDAAAGTGEGEFPGVQLFIRNVPTGINDSLLIAVSALLNQVGTTGGPIALVSRGSTSNGRVLPPGVIGDQTAGINNAGVIGGQSNGLPVLWIPNP